MNEGRNSTRGRARVGQKRERQTQRERRRDKDEDQTQLVQLHRRKRAHIDKPVTRRNGRRAAGGLCGRSLPIGRYSRQLGPCRYRRREMGSLLRMLSDLALNRNQNLNGVQSVFPALSSSLRLAEPTRRIQRRQVRGTKSWDRAHPIRLRSLEMVDRACISSAGSKYCVETWHEAALHLHQSGKSLCLLNGKRALSGRFQTAPPVPLK